MSGIAPWALLVFVVLERIAELWIANHNTRRLLADGAYEEGQGHYPVLVGLHVLWFVALALWLATGEREVSLGWLAVFVVAQVARIWVIGSLGRYWTTRIIVVPNVQLVCAGPYRWVRHPNYLVVAVEIFVLPMVYSAWLPAMMFSIANAVILWVRISEENRSLRRRQEISSGAASPTTAPPVPPPSATPH